MFTVMSSHPAYVTNDRSHLMKDNLQGYVTSSEIGIGNKKKRHLQQGPRNRWSTAEQREEALVTSGKYVHVLRSVFP